MGWGSQADVATLASIGGGSIGPWRRQGKGRPGLRWENPCAHLPRSEDNTTQLAINDKITLQGKVFGMGKRKCLDYFIIDSRSSARTTTGMLHKPPGPGDHYMVGIQIDMLDMT